MSLQHPWHQLERQSALPLSLCLCWPPHHVHTAQQCRLHWLGHMLYIADGRIPQDILYGELPSGKWPKGRPQLRYKNICKHHIMKALDSNTEIWKDTAANPISWLCLLKKQLKTGEERILNLAEERDARQSARTHKHPPSPLPSTSALYAAGTATSPLVLSATVHAVLAAALQTPMAQYPWSTNNWRRPTTTSHNNNNK